MSELRRRRRGRQRRASRKRTNLLLIIGGILASIVGGLVLVSAFAVHSVAQDLKLEANGLPTVLLGQNTRIYDKDGGLLGIIAGDTNRTVVRSQQIPRVLKDATVAIEDKRFYEHHGVDYYRLLGAAVKDLENGSASQGGSTITMQLAKNLYDPTAGRTLTKKIQEAYLAYQYEKKYTKDQILSKYLNGVFYGQNAIGVEAASLTFFDKHVWEISLPQAALLAGLPQAPTSYNPFSDPEAARARRNLVLDQMAQQGYISRDVADRAMKSGLALKRGTAYKHKREQYFFDYVRQVLVDRYGERKVELGGFKVYTTIDPHLQSAARRAIKAHLYYDTDPSAAVVMVDSHTGYIRAMASSQAYSADSQFNLATQALRQPGSTFKTFVLTRAIQDGINPYTTLYGSKKLDFVDPHYGPIHVQTYSHTYRGAIPIASALLSSDNSVFQQLTLDVGPDKVIQTAYDMGIPKARKLPDVASIGLGSGEVTPLDMATAYAALSNGGWRIQPLAIFKVVKPNGQVDNFAPERDKALTDGQAYEVTRILENNIQGGTGVAANIGQPAGGKTGTTSNYVDAWFVGYTPKYSTAVWVGYPNTTSTQYMTSVHGIAVAGGTFPAEIWHDFMSVVVARYGDAGSFPLPTNPVEWSPFSSDFTRRAGEANSTSSAASTKSTSTGTTTKSTTRAQQPPPSTAQPPAPTPPPTTIAPPVTTVAPPAPTPPPSTITPTPPTPPPTTPTPPPPTTP